MSGKPGGYVGLDFGELSRAACARIRPRGVMEYCANLELQQECKTAP
jgi:hypothetical protein